MMQAPVDYFHTQDGFRLRDCDPVLRYAARWRDRIPLHRLGANRPRQAKLPEIMACIAFRLRWAEPRFRVLATLAVLPLGLTVMAGLAFRLRPDTNMVDRDFQPDAASIYRACRWRGGRSPLSAWSRDRRRHHARRIGAVSCDRNCQDLVWRRHQLYRTAKRARAPGNGDLARNHRFTSPVCCR